MSPARVLLTALVLGASTGVLFAGTRNSDVDTVPVSHYVADTAESIRPSLAFLDSLVNELVLLDPWNSGASLTPVEPIVVTDETDVSAALPATLVLRGVVGPMPWTALVDGLPGASGLLVVSVGDSAGGWHVVRIWDDSVSLRSAATTVTLGVSRSWR